MVNLFRICVLLLCLLPFAIFQNCAPVAGKTFTTETKSDTKIPESRIPDPRLWSNGDGYGKPTVYVKTSGVCASGIYGQINVDGDTYMHVKDACKTITAVDVTTQVEVNAQNPNVIVFNGSFYEAEETAKVHPVEVFCRGQSAVGAIDLRMIDVALSYTGITDGSGYRHYSGYVISNFLNTQTGVIDTEYVIISDAISTDANSLNRTYRFMSGDVYRLPNSEQNAATLSNLPTSGGFAVKMSSPAVRYVLSQTDRSSGTTYFHNYFLGGDFSVTTKCYEGIIEPSPSSGSSSGGSTTGGSTTGGSTSGGSSTGGTTSGGSTSGGSTSAGTTSGGSTSGGSTSGGSTTGGSTSGGSTSGGSTSGGTTTQTNQQIVIAAYKAIFTRTQAEIDQDAAGIQYWVNRMNAGLTKADLEKALYASDEYYLRGLYTTIFKRRADFAGLTYWINQIKSGAKTRAQVKLDFEATCRARVTECK